MTSRLLKKHPTTPSSERAAKVRSSALLAGLLAAYGCSFLAPGVFADDATNYVTARASTLEADAASKVEPRRLDIAAEPIAQASATTETPQPAKLQWRAARRTGAEQVAQGTATGHTRLVAHEVAASTAGAAPRLIAASDSRGPARIAQLDPLNDDPFDDPFGDNGLNGGAQPRPIEELESDLPRREPLLPLDEEPAPLDPSDPPLDPSDPPLDLFDDPSDSGPGLPAPRTDQPQPTRPPLEPRPLPSNDLDRERHEEECAKATHDLLQKKLSDIDLSIYSGGVEGRDYPQACELDAGEFLGRHWCGTQFTWTASGLCHKPLYFEQVNVERYGHSLGPIGQPVLSAAHFFLSVPIIPYKMGVHPPNECIYALGYYRPGDCAPYFIPPIPISARGALFQAGAVVGVAAALP
ncbi:MAG: hypothetical protein WEA31_03680 [Pirellulales bacterium]